MDASRRKILFVDDEEAFLRMVKLNLEGVGIFEVRTESRGSRVIDACHQFHPDMIFLDVVMPDIDGGELLEMLKADKELSHIPVVFLTAIVTESEIGTAGGHIHGRDFLAKPVTTKKLVDCIRTTLG
jgi:CheY-like chemotaxis protein